MQVSDLPMTSLFLIFLMLFVMIGTSPAVHRWLDRLLGMQRRAEEAGRQEFPLAGVPPEQDYDAIVFQQLALAGDKGLSSQKLAKALHFDKPILDTALASLHSRGMIRRKSGLLGTKFLLTEKGRDRAIQEGIIPRLHSGSDS